ncbi:hypothetical protein [Nocardia sp. NPDC052316]|uniref:hypothetical protein n=1 Tax=Nocardia sp. NPDC052316 TaxID=3364329 RepID=UPI0037C60493
MSRIGRTVRYATAAVLLVAAACGTDDRTKHPPSDRTSAARPTPVPAADYTFPIQWAGDYTFRWSAAEGIDLTAPNAEVVRAFAESKRLARSVGNELAYPGYAAAVSGVDWLDIPDGGAYPPGAQQGNWQLRWHGTFLARLVRIQPEPNGFTAAYCLDTTNVADSIDGGAHYRWTRPGRRGELQRGRLIGLTARARSSSGPIPTEAVPVSTRHQVDRAPKYNVFDDWKIIDVWGPTSRGPQRSSLVAACAAWARANPQTNPVGIDSLERRIPADPPPIPETPFPGWPGP